MLWASLAGQYRCPLMGKPGLMGVIVALCGYDLYLHAHIPLPMKPRQVHPHTRLMATTNDTKYRAVFHNLAAPCDLHVTPCADCQYLCDFYVLHSEC